MILSSVDVKLLEYLKGKKEFEGLDSIAQALNENVDAIRRAVGTLSVQKLIDIKTNEKAEYKLGEFGELYIREKFPEEILAENLKEPKTIPELQKKLGPKAGLIIGIGKKQNLVEVKNGKLLLIKKIDLDLYKKIRDNLVNLKERKSINDKFIKILIKMPKMLEKKQVKNIFVKINKGGNNFEASKVVQEVTDLNNKMLKDGTWKNKVFKKYNVEADVEEIHSGKYQPYMRFLDMIRKKLVSLGFEEMETSLISTEFYNFDVLYQPQNHPARTWTDTYSIKEPNLGELPDKKIVNAIKSAHEDGGQTESTGWGYKWNPEIAMKLMPVAQGTAFSAKTLCEGIKIPGRYFALARVYRPDVLDATHLNEFNQLEGFVVSKDISFRHLLGLLKQFAIEVAGAEDVRFYPDYYPFTEPSVQMSAKHPELGWVELGGAGIFRPEFMENLGIKERAIAWGLGIDRLAMFNLDIKDIRDLFSAKLDWLRDKHIIDKI
jgi:phenylalanyl-tRNA synthetase alpha chain